ncbi:MAG: hypothetical protein MI920_27915 [Kiloniellales bacterium]|nr:hypothetical protein [Kiloniellales bacterium]
MRAVLAFLLTVLLAWGAAARSLTDEEQASLNQTRDLFLQGLKEADQDALVGVIPPRVLSYIANAAGVSEAALRSNIGETMAAAMRQVEIVNAEMVTENLEATEARDADGEPYLWGFAPTSMEMIVNGQRLKVESQTFVLLERARWYLIRTNEAQQVAILRTTYPFLQQVEFPSATMPAVAE